MTHNEYIQGLLQIFFLLCPFGSIPWSCMLRSMTKRQMITVKEFVNTEVTSLLMPTCMSTEMAFKTLTIRDGHIHQISLIIDSYQSE